MNDSAHETRELIKSASYYDESLLYAESDSFPPMQANQAPATFESYIPNSRYSSSFELNFFDGVQALAGTGINGRDMSK